MFFNSWFDLVRVIIVGTLSYFALILLLRTSGKRTLAKMNMFDFVITIALGSVFATLILSKSVALAEGVVGLGLLVVLQYVVAWLSVRFKSFQRMVKGSPTLLFYRGQYLEDAMLSERIATDEVRFAARSQGVANMDDLFAVVLETDGTFSVIPQADDPKHNALTDLKGGQKDNA
jgi:uncharacterized membrane protein YcaP (DUF421 family)